jgi:ubiquinone/menaquinone biosynthesis C-methylase UbiE
MNIYDKFAYFYTKGDFPQYSQRMATYLPAVFEKFKIKPQTLLDIACGEGAFVVSMVKSGYTGYGVDLSPQQIKFARKRAEKEKVQAEFMVQDIRSLSFKNKFDLVTCWFDSLNYLLELDDLEKTFVGVSRALKKGGAFIFDLNTILELAVNWSENKTYIFYDEDDRYLIRHHPVPFDFEKNIGVLKITGFMKKGKGWQRMDEVHKQRGYKIEEIRYCLKKANLKELACLGSLEKITELKPDSTRVWFVARK